MKRPSFQFYPADWRNNAKLRRCSWVARGAWIEVMGLLHDSDEYGLLRWHLKEIAQALGVPLAILKELAEKGVLKGADKGSIATFTYTPVSGRKAGPTVVLIAEQDGPIWYSSRMVRDEYVRQKKANHDLYKDSPNHSPMPPIGEAPNLASMPPKSDLPTSTSTSTLKTNTPIPPTGGDLVAIPKRERKKSEREPLHVFLDRCKAEGVKPIPADDPIFAYVNDVGLTEEMLVLAWFVFKNRYLDRKKLQKDWRAHYRNAVKSNWFKLWFIANDGTAGLTTAGQQAQREMEATKMRVAA